MPDLPRTRLSLPGRRLSAACGGHSGAAMVLGQLAGRQLAGVSRGDRVNPEQNTASAGRSVFLPGRIGIELVVERQHKI